MSEVTAVPLRPVGKSGLAALWIGIAALVLIGLGGGVWLSRAPAAAVGGADAFLRYNAARHGVVTTPSGLQYQVLKAGAGAKPTINDVALIDYRGGLTNGTIFDQTPPGRTVPLQLSRVVAGFAEGLQLMPKGSTYRFWIPPALGYGAQDNGPIPGNSVLVFDVTLHDSVPASALGQPQGM